MVTNVSYESFIIINGKREDKLLFKESREQSWLLHRQHSKQNKNGSKSISSCHRAPSNALHYHPQDAVFNRVDNVFRMIPLTQCLYLTTTKSWEKFSTYMH